jgi:hypothetical protein
VAAHAVAKRLQSNRVMSTIQRFVILSMIAMVTACSQSRTTTPDALAAVDARPVDSAMSADAPTPDALASIACGTAKCDVATQICVVRTPVGPSETYTCEPIPAGCAADRSCACVSTTVCAGAYSKCTDPGDPDTVVCECPQCQ